MHTKIIEIQIYDKGDYVNTPSGKGQIINTIEYDNISNQDCLIQLKEGTSNNPANIPEWHSKIMCILITKEEYERD